MAVTVKGTGVVWGSDGLAFTAGVVSATNLSIQNSVTFTRDSNKFDLPNEDGETVGQVFYNLKRTLSITVVPTGVSIAAAVTSLTNYTMAPGLLITITDSEGNTEDTYNLLTATENRTQDGAATVDLVMEAFDNTDPTAVISS